MTGNKYKAFYAAFNASVKAGNPLTKEEQVRAFTNERTDSLRELSDRELDELIRMLNKQGNESAERMRRHIIAMAHELGWELPNGKADMQRINAWVAKYGYLNMAKHELNQYTQKELPTLVTQFQKMYLSHLKRLKHC